MGVVISLNIFTFFVNGRWKEHIALYCFKEVDMGLGYSLGRDYYRFSLLNLLLMIDAICRNLFIYFSIGRDGDEIKYDCLYYVSEFESYMNVVKVCC